MVGQGKYLLLLKPGLPLQRDIVNGLLQIWPLENFGEGCKGRVKGVVGKRARDDAGKKTYSPTRHQGNVKGDALQRDTLASGGRKTGIQEGNHTSRLANDKPSLFSAYCGQL